MPVGAVEIFRAFYENPGSERGRKEWQVDRDGVQTSGTKNNARKCMFWRVADCHE